jgi:hypothetical protein
MATTTRNGSNADWGVPVVPGGVVTPVVGRGIAGVVVTIIVLVTVYRGAGV